MARRGAPSLFSPGRNLRSQLSPQRQKQCNRLVNTSRKLCRLMKIMQLLLFPARVSEISLLEKHAFSPLLISTDAPSRTTPFFLIRAFIYLFFFFFIIIIVLFFHYYIKLLVSPLNFKQPNPRYISSLFNWINKINLITRMSAGSQNIYVRV